VLVTLKTKRPLVKEFLYNEQIFDVTRIRSELETRNNEEAFNKLLRTCTFLLALSFLISSVLNYLMAKIYVHTAPSVNLEAFNAEVGTMQAWSYLFIVLPTSIVTIGALLLLLRGIKRLTGLGLEEAMKQQPEKS